MGNLPLGNYEVAIEFGTQKLAAKTYDLNLGVSFTQTKEPKAKIKSHFPN